MKISYKRIKKITGRLDETSLIMFCNSLNEEMNKRGLSKLIKPVSVEDRVTQLLLIHALEKLEK